MCELVFVHSLLGQANATTHPRLKGLLHRRAFELAQHLALMEAEGSPSQVRRLHPPRPDPSPLRQSALLRMCLSLRLRPVPRRQFPCWHACLTRPPRAEEIIRDPRPAMVGKVAPLSKSFQDMGWTRHAAHRTTAASHINGGKLPNHGIKPRARQSNQYRHSD